MEQNQAPACEIVRGEYFSGANEPAVTIRKATIKFSAACLRRLAGADYVLISVYRAEKRLVVEPCSSELRDAIRWSTMSLEKRQSKAITGKEFYSRICKLMQWREDCRYKAFGRVSSDGDGGDIIVFDLASALVYRPDADGRISRDPEYPQEWGDGFGMSIEEHRRNPLLRRFTEDTELVLASAAGAAIPSYNNDDMENGDEQQL